MIGLFQPRDPCVHELKVGRVAPLDLDRILERLRGDLLAIDLPRGHADADAVRRTHREAALAARLEDLRLDALAMPEAEDVECGYDGEVDDPQYSRLAGIVSWECPRCGCHREEDVDTEPDPDDARDMARDLEWEREQQ